MRRAARRACSSPGLDPIPSRFPEELRALPEADATLRFCMGILEAVEPYVVAVKIQAAFFERLGPVGMEDLRGPDRGVLGPAPSGHSGRETRGHRARRGRLRRGASRRLRRHLRDRQPLHGKDAVLPFLEEARRQDRGGGVFVLVATSNPSSREIQEASRPAPLRARRRAGRRARRPDGDYPDAGAVVGVTRPEIGARVRELLPETLFLSPGYGAQGGDASAVRPLLDRQGRGVLVNSSRSILYAYENSASDYKQAAREAARRTRDELRP